MSDPVIITALRIMSAAAAGKKLRLCFGSVNFLAVIRFQMMLQDPF